MIFYTWWFGKENAAYEKSISENEKNLLEWGHKFEVIRDEKYSGDPQAVAVLKDIEGLKMLSTIDCGIIDADLTLTNDFSKYDFSKQGAYSIWENNCPSIALNVSIGKEGQDWFAKVLLEKEQRGIQDVWCWPNKIYSNLAHSGLIEPFLIPENCYIHDRIQSAPAEMVSRERYKYQ